MIRATTNSKEWARAIRLWKEARGATHAEVINHFAVQTTYKAMSKTPKAASSSLPTSARPIKKNKTRITKKAREETGQKLERARLDFQTRERKRPAKSFTQTDDNRRKMMHALATGIRRKGGRWVKERGVHKGEGNYKEARRIYGQKRRSFGFTKAGFLKPLADLGEPMKRKPLKGGAAADSRGKEATKKKKVATVLNNATGSGDIAGPAMAQAMGIVIRQEGNYAIRKLKERDERFFARRFK